MQPQHRSYSKSFKTQVIQERAQPGASIANIALSHSLNANLVHKWIRLQSQKSVALQPTFIPLTPQPPTSRLDITAATICLEIPHPRVTVKVSWPTESAAACATFLRDLFFWGLLYRYRTCSRLLQLASDCIRFRQAMQPMLRSHMGGIGAACGTHFYGSRVAEDGRCRLESLQRPSSRQSKGDFSLKSYTIESTRAFVGRTSTTRPVLMNTIIPRMAWVISR